MGTKGLISGIGVRRTAGAAVVALVAGLLTSASGNVTAAEAEPDAQERAIVAGPVITAKRTVNTITGRWSRSVDVRSRAAVNRAYLARYLPYVDQSTGYAGETSRCQLGTQTAASRAGTLSSLNFVRSLGGLAPVRFTSTLNGRAQRTALIMGANNRLSHFPDSNWRCYTRAGGNNAARANIALAYPRITSATTVGLYMKEPGSNNHAVGHRRWLMNPTTTAMGTGSTDIANAITVVGPTSIYRPNPRYVSWPTAGWFPNPLEPAGRWSLSAGDTRTSFGQARVAVARKVGARYVGVSARKYAVKTGYARPTLAWQLSGSYPTTGVYRVTVTNIKRAGTTKRFSHRYYVKMFTPSS